MTTQTHAIRELTDLEAADASGGATMTIFGIRFHFLGDGSWGSICVDDGETYGCVTAVGGKVYTSSGPVPK